MCAKRGIFEVMKNVFLTSSLQSVAKDLAEHLDPNIKRFLFVITASELEKGNRWWLRADRKSMTELGFELENYTLTDKTKEQVKDALSKVDGIIMAGGNTFYLLWKIQQSDSAGLIKQFVKDGRIYIGSSAGSMVASSDIYASREKKEIDAVPDIKDFNGLGITDIMVQPHWGSKSFKESYLNEIMKHSYVTGFKQILLTDEQYVIDDGDNITFVDIKAIS